jgi:hypothetical protein
MERWRGEVGRAHCTDGVLAVIQDKQSKPRKKCHLGLGAQDSILIIIE